MTTLKSITNVFAHALFLTAVLTFTLTPVTALANPLHSRGTTNLMSPAPDPEITLNRTWIEYGVTEKNQKGMRIHVDLEISGLKGVRLKVVARVANSSDEFLKSLSSYSNDEGQLEASALVTPGFETTVYDDVVMFLPYSELKVARGSKQLKLDIDLKYDDGDLIKHLAFQPFVVDSSGNGSDAEEKEEAEITAEVNEIWVDYNVSEGRRKGMRLHVNFEVTGLKGVDSKLTARVKKENGDFLTSTTSFSNQNGELEISYEMKPGFPTTVYKDATLFLPYDELVLRKGIWNLKFDIDLNYEDGSLIQHLDYYDFEFTR